MIKNKDVPAKTLKKIRLKSGLLKLVKECTAVFRSLMSQRRNQLSNPFVNLVKLVDQDEKSNPSQVAKRKRKRAILLKMKMENLPVKKRNL
jgi:hypothetical protein